MQEGLQIFDQAYISDAKNDDPEQFRRIGLSQGGMCSVIFEIRQRPERRILAHGDYSLIWMLASI